MLQRIFDTLKPMRSILARELLGTALAAIEGQMPAGGVFQPRPQHGYFQKLQHWHPLEWFAKDSQGLFSEYHSYRELMAEAVLARPDNTLDAAAVRRVLDLIHLRYMVSHAPDRALAFIADQKMSGVPFDEYWPRPEIHQPLYEAAHVGTSAPATAGYSVEGGPPGSERVYNLHPNFSAPLGMAAPAQEAIKDLLHALDNYQPHLASAKTARAHLPARTGPSSRTQRPINRSVTVSVLLCNYNDARYLPDSLSAICAQTRLPEEVVVIDDGSTDNSVEIIEDFGRRYPFIRLLRNEANRGLLYSINRALNEARCDFVVWAAADDRLLPNFLERNAKCLSEHPAAGMTFSRLAVFTDGSDEITSFTERNYGTGSTSGPCLDSCRRSRCATACSEATYGYPPTPRWPTVALSSRSAGLTRSCAGTPTTSDSWLLRYATVPFASPKPWP